MSALERARELDAVDDRLGAVRAYEEALKSAEDDGIGLSLLLDLAVLYFTLLDPGEATARHLDQQFLDQAWERANDLLRQAEEFGSKNSEAEFWRRYFEYVVLGADPFVEDCEALAKSHESLVPFFYLWSESGGEQYCEEAQKLYESVSAGRTARERYIRSMVERAAVGRSAG